MSEFNFNSQVCTSRSQSERLLALGLKPDTADMVHCIKTRNHLGDEIERHSYYSFGTEVDECPLGYAKYEHFPAWSLGRLIEMIPVHVPFSLSVGHLCINRERIFYWGEEVVFEWWDNGLTIYDNIISCIEWLIKEGYFPKEYLV